MTVTLATVHVFASSKCSELCFHYLSLHARCRQSGQQAIYPAFHVAHDDGLRLRTSRKTQDMQALVANQCMASLAACCPGGWHALPPLIQPDDGKPENRGRCQLICTEMYPAHTHTLYICPQQPCLPPSVLNLSAQNEMMNMIKMSQQKCTRTKTSETEEQECTTGVVG